MSTLLKALNKAQQDRKVKLQRAGVAAPASAAATPIPTPPPSLPVDDNQYAAALPEPTRPHINPLLVPAPVAQPRADYSAAAMLLAASAVITIAANLLYHPAPASPVATSAKLTLDTVTIPGALLGADPVPLNGAGPAPLKLRMDRRAHRLPVRHSNAAAASRH
jgi:hypothetical protein